MRAVGERNPWSGAKGDGLAACVFLRQKYASQNICITLESGRADAVEARGIVRGLRIGELELAG